MKKFNLVIIFLLFVLELSFSQNVEVTYIKAYKNYKDKSDSEPKIIKGLEFKLYVNKDKSLFKYVESLDSDEIKDKRYLSRAKNTGVYYNNISNNEKLYFTESPINKTKYIVKYQINNNKWELLNDSKNINNYKCFKATTYNSYINPIDNMEVKVLITVWYAPEINLPFGPAGKDGLPGLVLEASSSSYYFIASHIDFKTKNTSLVKKPSKGKEVTEVEFEKIITEEFKEINN